MFSGQAGRGSPRPEARALVLDVGQEAGVIEAIAKADGLGRVATMAVADGVDEGFFEREADAELLAVGVAEGAEVGQDLAESAVHVIERMQLETLRVGAGRWPPLMPLVPFQKRRSL